jgi:hypothetical protein
MILKTGHGTSEDCTPSRIPSDEARSRLIGAWQLVSWFEQAPSGERVHPLGENAVGQIVYTADGHVSAQLVREEVPLFLHDDWRKATADESARAWMGYFGYFGTFSIDEEKQAVIHHVEGSWFPNLRNTDQVRFFRFEEGRLVLDADTQWGKVRIIWEKVKPS